MCRILVVCVSVVCSRCVVCMCVSYDRGGIVVSVGVMCEICGRGCVCGLTRCGVCGSV